MGNQTMTQGTFCLSLAIVFMFGICCADASQKTCQGNAGNRDVYAPFGSWLPLNCTHNCSLAGWESRLTKRNVSKGPGWISVQVEVGTGEVVNDWRASNISCTVLSNGNSVDNVVKVIPYEIPGLVTADMEDNLEEGKSYNVTCTVHGVAPIQNLMVTVLRGEEVIHQETFEDDSRVGNITQVVTYPITAQRSDNMKNYSCQATLALGTVIGKVTVQSSSVTVGTFTLPENPKLESDQWIEVGTKYIAKCNVINAFPLELLNLTMFFNETSLNVTTNMMNGSMLGFAEIPRDAASSLDIYRLHCKAQVLSLSTEAFMDIHIYESPNIEFSVSPDLVHLNETVIVSCRLNNTHPDRYEVIIRRNGEQICEGQTTCNVSVNGRSPQSVVSCEAFLKENKTINKKRKENITVHYAPLFQNNQCPDQFVLKEGDNGPFKCQADGNPPPSVTCSSDRGNLPTDKLFKIDRTHSGHYKCLATNQYGNVSKSVQVEVQYPPATPNITVIPTASISKGGALNITCWADGIPQPQYIWVIPAGATVDYLNNKSVIIIPEASSSHDGTYTCLAKNQHGEKSVDLVINVTNNALLVIILCTIGGVLLLAIIISLWCRKWKNGKKGFYSLWRPKQEKLQEEEMDPIKAPCNSTEGYGKDTGTV
ncbi:intercellular adhesion molecule 5 [Xenopus laevis]|uniref:Ig-like domain-containing protein n=2 Tax=Xenopus laevis TaxID=8355 RepID=A0A974HUG8_XENLA|nr:intercellular adhesion molecule 5 [Xenopus laevis]OCT90391.1 hypothetical protein XELAEV_18019003mg [Xenopus laevis]